MDLAHCKCISETWVRLRSLHFNSSPGDSYEPWGRKPTSLEMVCIDFLALDRNSDQGRDFENQVSGHQVPGDPQLLSVFTGEAATGAIVRPFLSPVLNPPGSRSMDLSPSAMWRGEAMPSMVLVKHICLQVSTCETHTWRHVGHGNFTGEPKSCMSYREQWPGSICHSC